MPKQFKYRLIIYAIYAILLTGIVLESVALVGQIHLTSSQFSYQSYKINIAGNIRKPGWYMVPEGTTQFEILKVAGVRTTSDLSSIDLSSQISNNQNLMIGTLDKPVAISNESSTAHLENFYGNMNIANQDGSTIPAQLGVNIVAGDKLQTDGGSQAELSLGTFSKIDMDNFTDITVEKINSIQAGKSVSEITHNTGTCWYKIVYGTNDQLFRVYTRSAIITVSGTGANFLIEIQSNHIVVNVMDGLALVEKRTGNETSNIIAGQSATIYDDERPIQITRLAPDISANEQFSKLTSNKPDASAQNAPLNFFFCVSPNIFYLVNVDFENSTTRLIRIPEELMIEQFTQGITSLDQAYLYGGPVLVSSFLERIFDTRIQKYISCTRDDIVRITGIIGGVSVDIDAKASKYVGLPRGFQKMSGKYIVKYLSPAVSGVSDSRERQTQVVRNLFNEFKLKNVVPTLMTADQLVNSSETNFSASEIVDQYARFNGKSNWNYQEIPIPTTPIKKNGKTYYNPQLDDCRKIINIY